MKLVVIGVNHKTTPVAMREQLAFSDNDIDSAYRQLADITGGSVIVSTCNRTEIYALVKEDAHSLPLTAAHGSTFELADTLSEWLTTFKGLERQRVEPYLYVHHETQALTHWLRVAAGLDSMILGEPQIFGQIKRAVERARTVNGLPSQLHWIVEQVFAGAKSVRSDTEVGEQAITLGFAAAKLATQIFDHPNECTLLIVAAGEMNGLVATHIAELGVKRIIICNRSPKRAQLLAAQLQSPNRTIEVLGLDKLDDVLAQADIISSCSGSMNTLIDKKMAKKALKYRRYRPMLMVDLAVPRDIDPKVVYLDDVYLYSVDDLQHVIAGNLEKRRQAAVEAELLVSHMVIEIERRFQVRKVGEDIDKYRSDANALAQALLNTSLAKLHNSEQSPETIMTELTHKLTRTLTHAPSTLMRTVAREGDQDVMKLVIDGLNTAYRQKRK